MSLMGHFRQIDPLRRSRHVRFAPIASEPSHRSNSTRCARKACARGVELAAPGNVVLSNGPEMDFMLTVTAAVVSLRVAFGRLLRLHMLLDLKIRPYSDAVSGAVFALSALLETIEPLTAKNGNQLAVHCDAAIGTMYADQMRLRQALLNLMSNGNKFTDRAPSRSMPPAAAERPRLDHAGGRRYWHRHDARANGQALSGVLPGLFLHRQQVRWDGARSGRSADASVR